MKAYITILAFVINENKRLDCIVVPLDIKDPLCDNIIVIIVVIIYKTIHPAAIIFLLPRDFFSYKI